MKLEDEGYEDKLHQLMEVGWQSVCMSVFTQRGELVGRSVGDSMRAWGYACGECTGVYGDAQEVEGRLPPPIWAAPVRPGGSDIDGQGGRTRRDR